MQRRCHPVIELPECLQAVDVDTQGRGPVREARLVAPAHLLHEVILVNARETLFQALPGRIETERDRDGDCPSDRGILRLFPQPFQQDVTAK